MDHKLDPRVVRTRHMLRDALIPLILEKGYDNVTIQDITDRAGLRRATFYLHYKDKEELLLAILSETFDELRTAMDKLPDRLVGPESELRVHEVIFSHAAAHSDLYLSILRGHGATTITHHIREYLTKEFLNNFALHNPAATLTIPLDVLANFSATIKLNMALWWLEQGMPYTPRQMSEMCARLTLGGAQAALQPHEQ